ncbi:MAG: DUF362 domain-containing protein [Christensenellales bacterium]|jgi:hypothetical protein
MLSFKDSLMPKVYRVRQKKEIPFLADPELEIAKQMEPYLSRIKKGGEIGIAAGSRGIYNYARMVKAVADNIKKAGANPVIIPAMGSHGGATAEGQRAVLAGYGITEESMGCPVRSSMDVEVIGYTDAGTPVHYSTDALKLDGVIMVNRIKAHTDFHGKIESGLMKQMVIGLGKHAGATTIHRRGVSGLANDMPASARLIMEKANVLMGVAIIENEEDKTANIEVIPVEHIEERELELLPYAKSLMPSLPCTDIDLLVISEMGKNISGTGIDPNIVGRMLIRDTPDEPHPHIYRIGVLDLTEESHGNAIGVGIADLIPRRMYEKIDLRPTYINTITSGFLERGFLPIVVESDREVIEVGLHCANRLITKENARLVFCKNTLFLKELVVSEAILPELLQRGDIEVLGEETLSFDQDGYFSAPLFD